MKFNVNRILMLAILLLAALIRLRGFVHHYTLASDSARDLLVAHGAILSGRLPWVGSFSSAGPFVFGPNWYWWLMFWNAISPNFFLAPWLGMLLVSLVYILVMYLVGKVAIGPRFGLILALFTTVTSPVIGLSAYLTQHAMVEIFSGLALLGLVSYSRYRHLAFAFLTGLAVGAGLSMHYQAINLLVYLPILFIFEKPDFRKWLKLGVTLAVALLVFLWPLLLWDASRGFQNILQLAYYFRVGQYRFFVSNRWLTYLGIFWVEYLGKYLGGEKLLTLGIILAGLWFSIKSLIRHKLPKTILWPIVILVIQLVMLRYFRGEKYDGYLVYLHSVIVFITGWVLLSLTRVNRWLGMVGFLFVVFFNMQLNMPILDWNNDGKKLSTMLTVVEKKYPSSKFTIYAKGLSSSNCAYSFSVFVEGKHLGADRSTALGICQNQQIDCGQQRAMFLGQTSFQGQSCTLVDLKNIPMTNLSKSNDWYNFSAPAVYDDVQNWWRKSQ